MLFQIWNKSIIEHAIHGITLNDAFTMTKNGTSFKHCKFMEVNINYTWIQIHWRPEY